ncbi:alpha-ketoglutarate-dependent dioxygenase alkB homolog 7, mitochondrial [Xenopus tropicalis]|uniref:AlkB homolog 7 n=1 Tax=Xenopus tropicalis TaxID=8364 RepID=F6WL76_XENTR|nr:alpha-ketoglutarate-dependent dioxygenase alkB homolog 7, mitochondrial [Xenopus tropicalis]|eukprot:XP_002940667.2 PREDICTED: alpha-ketoglutarate-dependent dioxygenase alkB homolog 7, mitochondrial isoform X1 [Xenopus tropicalis]
MAAAFAVPGCLGNMRLLVGPRCRAHYWGSFPAGALQWGCRRSSAVRLSSLPPENLLSVSCQSLLSRLCPGLTVVPDFVSPAEESVLFGELEPVLKRKRYEGGHWDEAIHGFRETERLQWSPENSAVLQRVREKAFPPGEEQLSLVHVLDLKKEGYIKAHVDSVKFCGSTIAGICLLSSSIMRLVSVDNSEERADLLLPRRCLYVLSGKVRYNFTHEILRDEESFFNGAHVQRERRISVICRNLPAS